MRNLTVIVILWMMALAAGCTTARQRDAERRAQLESYSYSYELAPDQYGIKSMKPRDRRMLETLADEGWRLVREDRQTRGNVDTVTLHYER